MRCKLAASIAVMSESFSARMIMFNLCSLIQIIDSRIDLNSAHGYGFRSLISRDGI